MCSAVGLEPNPDWVVAGSFDLEGGKKAAEQFIRLDSLPEVILCAADVTAIGVMEVHEREGIRIPNDVSIVGFDDIAVATYVRPQLTTVHQDTQAMGTLAAKTLVHLIEREDLRTPQHYVLPTELVVRQSTRPLPLE